MAVLAAVAAFVLAADLATKAIVVAHLRPDQPVHLIGNVLTLWLTRNPGAAFSVGTGETIVFTVIAFGVVVYIARTARRLYSVGWAIALGLLLGGAMGNLGDRIFRAPGLFRGYVVDWIGVVPRYYPIFNLADSAIVCGGILTVILALRGYHLDGTRSVGGHGAGAGRRAAGPVGADGAVSATGRLVYVPEGLDGERLDSALARMFGFSRAGAAELIAAGDVLVDGRPAAKSDRVTAGAELAVTLPPPPGAAEPVIAEPIPGMGILYEDDDIVVVDKPRGVAAHPTPGWTGPTVTGGLLGAGHRVSTSGAAERQGIVHRLDANTTGVMVVAKSEPAYSALKQAFRDRTVSKTYHALIQGHPDPLRGTVDAPIGRHPSGDGRFAVVADGRPSVTHYDTIEAFRAASLLSVGLETGRTHQIRVHMAALRHPCCGDLLYGADPVLAAHLGLTRQWLHAVRLSFEHPSTGREVVFESQYPDDLAHALDVLAAES